MMDKICSSERQRSKPVKSTRAAYPHSSPGFHQNLKIEMIDEVFSTAMASVKMKKSCVSRDRSCGANQPMAKLRYSILDS
jgi:hypothetical protein